MRTENGDVEHVTSGRLRVCEIIGTLCWALPPCISSIVPLQTLLSWRSGVLRVSSAGIGVSSALLYDVFAFLRKNRNHYDGHDVKSS